MGDWVRLAGVFVGFGLVVIIPVVAILTEHQRKMARILHGLAGPEEASEKSPVVIGFHANVKGRESDNQVLEELRALRSEVADLKMQVASLPAPSEKVREPLPQP